MKLSSRLKMYATQALLLALAVPGAALAAPEALSTLDVCHNAATGNWRYSGMVAVPRSLLSATSVVGVDYWVQNNTSPAGYRDTLRIPGDTSLLPIATASGARLSRFQAEAAPLSLGTLRNHSVIAIADPLKPAAAPLLLQPVADYSESVCGCPHPSGCTRTQGYWKSKPGVIWPAPYNRGNAFHSSGLSYQQLLEQPPQGGNAYVILAHQTIAALLNRAAGASAPSSLQNILNSATAWFASGTTLASCGGSACEQQKNWAAMLDTYNNGQYPGAPTHCPE